MLGHVKVTIRKEPIKFIVIDLERSLAAKVRIYWKAKQRGYTPDITNAGIYRLKIAREIALNDIYGMTVLMPVNEEVIQEINKDRKIVKMYED